MGGGGGRGGLHSRVIRIEVVGGWKEGGGKAGEERECVGWQGMSGVSCQGAPDAAMRLQRGTQLENHCGPDADASPPAPSPHRPSAAQYPTARPPPSARPTGRVALHDAPRDVRRAFPRRAPRVVKRRPPQLLHPRRETSLAAAATATAAAAAAASAAATAGRRLLSRRGGCSTQHVGQRLHVVPGGGGRRPGQVLAAVVVLVHACAGRPAVGP